LDRIDGLRHFASKKRGENKQSFFPRENFAKGMGVPKKKKRERGRERRPEEGEEVGKPCFVQHTQPPTFEKREWGKTLTTKPLCENITMRGD